MSAIALREIAKRFGDTQAVYPTDLEVAHGELVTLLGPSGSGKSTILSMIAGLLPPSQGRVYIGGQDVTDVPPARRNLGMVFQSYALFPHMSVFDNVAFPLTIRKLSRRDIETKVMRTLEMVQLDGLAKRKQAQLSGGQQQRVALARALVFEPDILLLDEPMGALDKKLREQLQLELRQLQRDLGVTTLLVTHDQEEALSLSTRVVVLDQGSVQQIGTPSEAYRRPANRFVAEFIGTANLLAGEIHHVNGKSLMTLASGEQVACAPSNGYQGKGMLLIRPEHTKVHGADHTEGLPVKVAESVYMGQHTRLHLNTAEGEQIIALAESGRNFQEGEPVKISWAENNTWVIPA